MNSAGQREVDRLDQRGLSRVIPADQDVDTRRELEIEFTEHAVVADCDFPNHDAFSHPKIPAMVKIVAVNFQFSPVWIITYLHSHCLAFS